MVVSLVNQKGGTGKTTSTVNLGIALAGLQKNVLLVDLDPQGSLSFSLGIHDTSYSIADIFKGKATIEEVLVSREGLDVLPADVALADLEISLSKTKDRQLYLKRILEKAQGYDYILIDCPPSLSLLTINALNASQQAIIPLQMEALSIIGLQQILSTIQKINTVFNPQLHVLGVLPVMVDNRKNLTREVLHHIEENFQVSVFSTHIRTNVKASEAPSFGKSLLHYAPQSNSAKDYKSLVQEILQLTIHKN